MVCSGKSTNVRVIDILGNDCSGNPIHVFDLNNIPFNIIASDGASCSGLINVDYQPIDCVAAGLITGGVKVFFFCISNYNGKAANFYHSSILILFVMLI